MKNCLVTHHSSNIFKLSYSSKVSMNLIERFFPIIADSDNFLELDFDYIRKILSSNGLNIDSELQVFNAADSWLSHDMTERGIYAKHLLSKVRLPLLSTPALKQILDRVSSKYYECSNIIETVLVRKEQLHPFSCNIKSRYCNQTNFLILVCGGRIANTRIPMSDVKLLNANNLSEVENLSHMNEARCYSGAVCVKGEIYVFGGIVYNRKKPLGDEISIQSVEKYSPKSNTWKYLSNMIDDRRHFSICSLMDNVYIIGGLIGHVGDGGHELATCLEFSTKSLKWKQISRMNNARRLSACSVFEGKIVVSGGYYNASLNTVEAYDHAGDTWENMPNMIDEREGHKSVAVKNKLFIVGGYSTNNCEVFDSSTNKFTMLKQPTYASGIDVYYPTKVITIGSKIFVFKGVSEVTTFDFTNDEWSVKTCEATRNIVAYSMLKCL